MPDWIYWALAVGWWLVGAPATAFAMLYLAYRLAEKKPNRKSKETKQKENK